MKAVRFSQGFTLVELMVALALGVMMSAATLQIFLNTKNLSGTEAAMSRMQETGRFGLNELVKDIRMVGYQGCADPNEIQIINIAEDLQGASFNSGELRAFEVNADGAFLPALDATDVLRDIQAGTVGAHGKSALPGSDVITVQYANTIDAQLATDTATSSNVKITSNPIGLSQNDFAMISDCKSAHIFQITNVTNGSGSEVTFAHGSSGNTTNKILPGYDVGARVMQFESKTYFVADTGRRTETGARVTALYVKEFTRPPQELLEGVESLHLQYGQLLRDTGNIRYVNGDDANLNMDDVVSVRVGILVQSYEQVAANNDTRTYSLPGRNVSNADLGAHAGDRAVRKPFIDTVRLRNKRVTAL